MAELVESIQDVRRTVAVARASGTRIGLVPTMGALHDGHVRLIADCRAEAGLVVVSIFVNPTQFGPGEDFERYPRPIEDDLQRCEAAGRTPGIRTLRQFGLPQWLALDVCRSARSFRRPRRGQPARSFSRGRDRRPQAIRDRPA